MNPPSTRRQQRSRQARRALFWGVAILGMIQGGLALQIEFGDWRYRDRTYEHRLTKLRQRLSQHRLTASAAPRLALFLGSSTVLHAMRGDLFEKEMSQATQAPWLACNLSSPSSGTLLANVYLHRLLREGLKPDLIVVEVHPLMQSSNTQDEIRFLRARRYGYHDLEKFDQSQVPQSRELWRDWLREFPFPWHAHRFCLLAAHAHAFVPFDNHDNWAKCTDHTGWMPINDSLSPEARRERWDKYREFFAGKLEDLNMVPAEHNALRDLLRSCREQNLPVALVINPRSPSLQAWLSAKAKATFQNSVDQVRAEFGVPVLDAHDWVEETHYSDPLHVAVSGADIYTRKLVRDGLVPLLRQTVTSGDVVAAANPGR